MLGIPETIAAAIAEMPTKHSWLAPMLKLQGEEYDEALSSLERQIEERVTKMWPEAPMASRMVREVAGLYLERRALMEWAEAHPMQSRNLAVPETVGEAVELAAAEVMYVSQAEKMAARKTLQMMDEGLLAIMP